MIQHYNLQAGRPSDHRSGFQSVIYELSEELNDSLRSDLYLQGYPDAAAHIMFGDMTYRNICDHPESSNISTANSTIQTDTDNRNMGANAQDPPTDIWESLLADAEKGHTPTANEPLRSTSRP